MNQTNLNSLITMKFSLESRINSYSNTNINNITQEYINRQRKLVEQITNILMEHCQHNWIYDYIDEPLFSKKICYCNKCFIYKTNIKTNIKIID
tara:strand:+ start:65 stop:346 length:282 start_codon:yes stop_codon:yes gene_type:complete